MTSEEHLCTLEDGVLVGESSSAMARERLVLMPAIEAGQDCDMLVSIARRGLLACLEEDTGVVGQVQGRSLVEEGRRGRIGVR